MTTLKKTSRPCCKFLYSIINYTNTCKIFDVVCDVSSPSECIIFCR